MPKRSRTKAKPKDDDADDVNVTAFRVLQQAIGEIPRPAVALDGCIVRTLAPA